MPSEAPKEGIRNLMERPVCVCVREGGMVGRERARTHTHLRVNARARELDDNGHSNSRIQILDPTS